MEATNYRSNDLQQPQQSDDQISECLSATPPTPAFTTQPDSSLSVIEEEPNMPNEDEFSCDQNGPLDLRMPNTGSEDRNLELHNSINEDIMENAECSKDQDQKDDRNLESRYYSINGDMIERPENLESYNSINGVRREYLESYNSINEDMTVRQGFSKDQSQKEVPRKVPCVCKCKNKAKQSLLSTSSDAILERTKLHFNKLLQGIKHLNDIRSSNNVHVPLTDYSNLEFDNVNNNFNEDIDQVRFECPNNYVALEPIVTQMEMSQSASQGNSQISSFLSNTGTIPRSNEVVLVRVPSRIIRDNAISPTNDYVITNLSRENTIDSANATSNIKLVNSFSKADLNKLDGTKTGSSMNGSFESHTVTSGNDTSPQLRKALEVKSLQISRASELCPGVNIWLPSASNESIPGTSVQHQMSSNSPLTALLPKNVCVRILPTKSQANLETLFNGQTDNTSDDCRSRKRSSNVLVDNDYILNKQANHGQNRPDVVQSQPDEHRCPVHRHPLRSSTDNAGCNGCPDHQQRENSFNIRGCNNCPVHQIQNRLTTDNNLIYQHEDCSNNDIGCNNCPVHQQQSSSIGNKRQVNLDFTSKSISPIDFDPHYRCSQNAANHFETTSDATFSKTTGSSNNTVTNQNCCDLTKASCVPESLRSETINDHSCKCQPTKQRYAMFNPIITDVRSESSVQNKEPKQFVLKSNDETPRAGNPNDSTTMAQDTCISEHNTSDCHNDRSQPSFNENSDNNQSGDCDEHVQNKGINDDSVTACDQDQTLKDGSNASGPGTSSSTSIADVMCLEDHSSTTVIPSDNLNSDVSTEKIQEGFSKETNGEDANDGKQLSRAIDEAHDQAHHQNSTIIAGSHDETSKNLLPDEVGCNGCDTGEKQGDTASPLQDYGHESEPLGDLKDTQNEAFKLSQVTNMLLNMTEHETNTEFNQHTTTNVDHKRELIDIRDRLNMLKTQLMSLGNMD